MAPEIDGASPSSPLDEAVLWDVLDEHLDELEFCLKRLQRSHKHPLLTLAQLARTTEPRIMGHLDGLLVAGNDADLEIVKRFAEEIDPERPERMTAVTLVLASGDLDEAAVSFFAHEDPRIRMAAVRGCALAGNASLDRAAAKCLAQARTDVEKGAWLELMGLRELLPNSVATLLKSEEPTVVAAALRCLRSAIPSLVHRVEELAEHDNPVVRERALRVALAWGTPRAFTLCEAQAFNSDRLTPLAMMAYAILGGSDHHARLVQASESKELGTHALRALGFTGSVEIVPVLLERLGAKDPMEAKLAAQAIVAITGIDLKKDEFAAPPPKPQTPRQGDSLPPLEEDLGANLVPAPEEELPCPNASAIQAWWMLRARGVASNRPLVLGMPRTPDALLDALDCGPVGLRQGWALAASIWSRGAFWLDEGAFSAAQRAQLARARTGVEWSSEEYEGPASERRRSSHGRALGSATRAARTRGPSRTGAVVAGADCLGPTTIWEKANAT